jgi:hypothetical protein
VVSRYGIQGETSNLVATKDRNSRTATQTENFADASQLQHTPKQNKESIFLVW